MDLIIVLWSSEMYALATFATAIVIIVGIVKFIVSIRDGIREDKEKRNVKKTRAVKEKKEKEFLETLSEDERLKYQLRKEKLEADAYYDYLEEINNQ